MTNKKKLLAILLFSLALSLFGFFIDSDAAKPNLGKEVFEISIMTLALFASIATVYYIATFSLSKLEKLFS